MSMALGKGMDLVQEMEGVIFHLAQVEERAIIAEAIWVESGNGTPTVLWSAEQKQAFQDIRAHTETLRDMLLSREVNL